MSVEKTPQGKKRLMMDRDHISPGNCPQQFRKAWPKKKAKINRAFRLRARVALATSPDDAAVDAIRRMKAVKWGIYSMREFIDRKLARRASMHGAHKRRQAARSPTPEPG